MSRHKLFGRTAWSFAALSAFVVIVLVSTHDPVQADRGDKFPKPVFNEKGELVRPDVSYREWVYIGTPLTPNDLNPPEAPFPDFHKGYNQKLCMTS